MGPKTKELAEVLSRLIVVLNNDENYHWAQWMTDARKRIVASDYSGIEKVLLAYGGMGSFNDVYLTTITKYNCEFSVLQSRAWELATAIKHEYESAT